MFRRKNMRFRRKDNPDMKPALHTKIQQTDVWIQGRGIGDFPRMYRLLRRIVREHDRMGRLVQKILDDAAELSKIWSAFGEDRFAKQETEDKEDKEDHA